MTDPTCALCDRPTHDNSPACPRCWAQHRQRLAEIPYLITETTLTLARQNAASGHNNTRRTERPLPYSQAASDALTALQGALCAWAALARDEGHHLTPTLNPTHLARQLLTLDYHGWPHTHDAAPDYITEIRTHTRNLWSTIDTPTHPTYAGACPDCGTDLYAHRTAPAAVCHQCGTTTRLDNLIATALTEAKGRTWTIPEATTLLRYAGYTITVDKLTRSARRVTPVGHDPEGEPLYNLTDLQHVAD